MKGGRITWKNPTTGATYSEIINDTTESKLAAANARAATALSTTVAALERTDHRGQKSGNRPGDKLK